MQIPVVKNRNYIVDIVAAGNEDGEGIGKIDGLTVFVPGALIGEKIEVKIVKVKKDYAYGRIEKIIKPSDERIEPFCSVYKYCGGCSLQHMSYAEQLRYKRNKVAESIERIGKIKDVIVHETIGMDNAFEYRNKAQYPVGIGESAQPCIGFFYPRSHRVVDVSECRIQHHIGNIVSDIMKKVIMENNIPVYDEFTAEGILRHIVVRAGYRTGEVMVILVTNGRHLPRLENIVTALIEGVPGIKSIVQNINSKITNVILGKTNITLWGADAITDYIGDFRFIISPLSFFQVNPIQTEVLYNKALEYAALEGSETVFDLYCGIGTISLFLSRKAAKVYGVESVADAVRDAEKNAELNGVKNVEFIAGEAEKVVPELYAKGIRADVAVVDPPRKGCDEALLKTLVEMQPKRIVYVSCNPATLARDLGYLDGQGYRVAEVQPVDMFPWTAHVECVIGMQRKDT